MKYILMIWAFFLAGSSEAQTDTNNQIGEGLLRASGSAITLSDQQSWHLLSSSETDGRAFVVGNDGRIGVIQRGDTIYWARLTTPASPAISNSSLPLSFLNGSPMAQASFTTLITTPISDGTISAGQFAISNALFIDNTPELSGNLNSVEQHDAVSISYSRGDYSDWLKASTGNNQNSITSLSIFTSSSTFPNNLNGAIYINQGGAKQFGLQVDSSGAILGWTDSAQQPLFVHASYIGTNAEFLDNSLIKSGTGLLVSNGNLLASSMPPHAEGYFISTGSGGNSIVVEDREAPGADGFSAVILKQNGITNSIQTISSSSTSLFKSAGTFLIQSENSNGMLFNAVAGPEGSYGSIRFAINDDELVRIDASRSVLIGTETPSECCILAITSQHQGVKLPTMTSWERQHIKNPEEGTEVYDTDLHKKCVFTGKYWEKLYSKRIKETI